MTIHHQVAQFLRYLAIERNSSQLTIKSYREDLIDLSDYLADAMGANIDAEKVTPRDLRGYVAALHDAGYAQASISRKLASLRSFYRFAQRQQMCSTNPAKPLRNPRGARKLPHFLSTDEIGKLLVAPGRGDWMGLRDRAILETMYSAGLRVSEVVGLNDCDLDFSEEIARVRGKGRKERLAPLGKYAVEALRNYMPLRKFPVRRPKAVRPPFSSIDLALD
ncbi:MAG: site-specific integrase [Pirellulales bacterium]